MTEWAEIIVRAAVPLVIAAALTAFGYSLSPARLREAIKADGELLSLLPAEEAAERREDMRQASWHLTARTRWPALTRIDVVSLLAIATFTGALLFGGPMVNEEAEAPHSAVIAVMYVILLTAPTYAWLVFCFGWCRRAACRYEYLDQRLPDNELKDRERVRTVITVAFIFVGLLIPTPTTTFLIAVDRAFDLSSAWAWVLLGTHVGVAGATLFAFARTGALRAASADAERAQGPTSPSEATELADVDAKAVGRDLPAL